MAAGGRGRLATADSTGAAERFFGLLGSNGSGKSTLIETNVHLDRFVSVRGVLARHGCYFGGRWSASARVRKFCVESASGWA